MSTKGNTYIVGSGGGGKGGGGSVRTPVEAPNTLKSKSYVKIIEVLCEGEIEGLANGMQSIFLDKTPLQNSDGTFNFSDVVVEERNGTLDQAITSIGGETASTVSIGTEIKYDSPVEYTIINPDVDKARVAIRIPALTKQSTDNGDLNGSSVKYKIEYNPNGTGWIQPAVGTTVSQVNPNSFTSVASVVGAISVTSPFTSDEICTGQNGNNCRIVKNFSSATVNIQYQKDGGSWTTFFTTTVKGENQVVNFSLNTVQSSTYSLRAVLSGGSYSFSFVNGYVPSGEITISGKTTSPYERDTEFKLTGSAPWIIRVTRLTPDSTSSTLQNKTYLSSVTSIFEEKFRYPATAYMALSIDAEQFSSIPERAYEVKLLKIKVPSNYNTLERTYTGVWDGTFKVEWSDNPAWCFYDLLTNKRYGLGDRIDVAQIDKWQLYDIAQYCDELVDAGNGELEPRFTCNLLIQTREEAYKVLQDMASVFAGMTYWGSSSDGFQGVIPVADKPQDTYAYIYNNSNVVDGVFSYQTANVNTQFNAAYVTYNDPDNNYEQAVIYVPDNARIAEDGFLNETNVVAFGCTSRAQATRFGRRVLYTNKYENELLNFSVGADGAVPTVGSIIQVSDTLRAGERRGGRVKEYINPTTLKLDTSFTFVLGTTYSISVIGFDGKFYESQIVNPNTTTDTVTLVTPLTNNVAKNSAFILSDSGLLAELYKVVVISETDNHVYSVTAVKHDPSKYGYIDDLTELVARDTSNLSAQSVVADVTVSDYVYKTSSNTLLSKMDISWEKPSSVVKGYIVEYKKPDGNWVKSQESSNASFEIDNVTDGVSYTIRIYCVNFFGQTATEYFETQYTPLGKLAPPENVTGTSYSINPSTGIVVRWNAVSDVDVDFYVVRVGASWETGAEVIKTKSTSFIRGFVSSETLWVKALDTSGNYSVTADSIVIDNALPIAPSVTTTFEANLLRISWNIPTSVFLIDHYYLEIDGLPSRTVKGTTIDVEITWAGSKQVKVAAVDIGDRQGTFGTTTVVIVPPIQPIVTQEVIDNNVLLRWSDSKQTLPISTYEIRKGTTWASATVVGKVSAQFSVIFEKNAGNFTYLIAAYDTAGNMSSVGSVAALVNQPPDYVLLLDYNSNLNGTLSSAVKESSYVLLPVNTTQTWTTHFTDNGRTTPQQQIDAGFSYYLQPTPASGYYEEIVDYGTIVGGTKVSVTPVVEGVAGTVTYSIDISVRATTGDAWTDYTGLSSIYATNFRYVKVRITATSTNDDLNKITSLNIRLDTKLKNDAGRYYLNSVDSGGTTIPFNISFVDIQSITVTPEGTTPSYAIYDFVDVPNPTSFKGLLFNTAGTRISGWISWSAKGV